MNEMTLIQQPGQCFSQKLAKQDPKENEQYLRFKYQELPSILMEEDLMNVLKKYAAQEKSVKSMKIRKVIDFFFQYFFTEKEINTLFDSMFTIKGGNQFYVNASQYKLNEKKSLILEALKELLLD